MTNNQKTWTVLALVVVMLLLVLWLFEKRRGTQTQTSVNLGGGMGAYQFPIRNEQNQMLLRQCTYTNGHTLTLDPNAAGGQCPPVFTGLDGNPGNLVRDEVITIPWAGQSTVNQTPPIFVPPPGVNTGPIGDPEFTS